MPVREAATPAGDLFRIGRAPDPLAWPSRQYIGDGRFDDPARQFRTIYASQQRRSCFLEVLASFRPDPKLLARLQAVTDTDEPIYSPVVPSAWRRTRRVGRFRLAAAGPWLDLRAPETHQVLRQDLARLLVELGIPDFDVSAALGPSRALTQAISRWAYERSYQGIVYASRLDSGLNCWAIFEGAVIDPSGPPEGITPDDPDLLAVAALFQLSVK